MINPHDELRSYFNKLIDRYLNINSLRQQPNSVSEWTTNTKSPDNIEAFNLGHYFLQLANYSISRIVLVELSMFLSEKEDRSLLDWLCKTKEHAGSMKPTRYDANLSRQEPIKPEKYRAVIDDHIAQLRTKKDVINRIKAHRDKMIVHMDRKCFDNTESIERDYPLTEPEIDDLMDRVSCILREHYSCILRADVSLEVRSIHNVGKLLEYARAWMRVRRDPDFVNKGFRPVDYERDDYPQNRIS